MKNPKIIFIHGHAYTGTSSLIRDMLLFIYRDDTRNFFDITISATKYSVNKSRYSRYEAVVMDLQQEIPNKQYDYFNRFLMLGKRSLVVLTAFGSMRNDLLRHLSDTEYQDFIDNHDILDIETFREEIEGEPDRYIRSFSHNGSPIQYFDGTYDERFVEAAEDSYQYRLKMQDKLNALLNLERYRK